MSRVGIITLYYNNDNYGGIAQAYALCEQIKKMGHEPELISYQYTPSQKRSKLDKIKEKGIFQLINDRMIYLPKLVIQKMGNKIAKKKYGKDAAKDIELRKKAFAESRDRISHSSVYTEDIMEDCVERYDIFVSGSDQIWKPGVVQGPYVLSFVPDGKKRFSYASSIAVTTLDEAYGEYMKEALGKYSWVSVREQASKEYLEKLLKRNVDVVVDPTLLLSKAEWENNVSSRLVEGDYIFAYLLGESTRQRKIITRYAKNNNLKIVTLPYLEGEVRNCDTQFGDIRLFDVTLQDFISLIKYAKVVFTDSFHAVIFSNLFETNFFVFEREVLSKRANMGSRLDTLLTMMDEKDRKLSNRIDTKILMNYKDIDFKHVEKRLQSHVTDSKEKLKTALED